MKKRNLTSLELKKTIVSNLEVHEIKGGLNISVIFASFCCTIDKH